MKILLAVLFLYVYIHASDEQYKMGESIYKQTCLSCHGANGQGNPDVNFIVNPRNLSKTILREEQAYEIIKHGAHEMGASADIMPSFKSVFNEEELRSVAHYIFKKFDPKSTERVEKLYAASDVILEDKKDKMLKRGKKIYFRNCAWCHGGVGDGNGEATRNPEMSIFPYNLEKSMLDEKQMFLYSKYGGVFWGTSKEDMPSWSKKYDDYTLKSVVKYIRAEFKSK